MTARRKASPSSRSAASRRSKKAPGDSTPPRRRASDRLWDSLLVIDRLEVGPVRLEPNRLVVPYTVHQKGKPDTMDLVYRYEEEVFDPAHAAADSLARMAGVQVALNYGLFCREILFHGDFDAHDRDFIEKMMENTSREIAVKKLLQPNPFLVAAAASLPVVHPERWTRSRLYFRPTHDATRRGSAARAAAGAAAPAPSTATQPWSQDPERIAVLSSGGKDSLLSFGLLRELEQVVHPIFLNEAGKHWLTARNAYRSQVAQHPGTARVWTNSDRLFSWFLRHLPFIRPDFLSVRSDEYPIRLWTVAVFLFGAIPLLRKRGIGRLVIGDEFDTTRRARHQGIPHYDGLYDQSRYFDREMTRYFGRKGWKVQQFSILRPLSEMLIQRILARRYPDLFRDQVSCHAAHVEQERVFPCGKCEKCRRIVAMLVAQDLDPTHCGYKPAQIEACLLAFARSGVHQESQTAEHVAHLLRQKGTLPAVEGGIRPRSHLEVTKLRFDRERSPLDDIPKDLQEGLLRILLSHTRGALRREGSAWVQADVFVEMKRSQRRDKDEPPAAGTPRRRREDALLPGTAANPPATGPAAEGSPTMDRYLWGELTWPEAKEMLRAVDVAILPVGAIEQHGPHLPLDTDSFDADYLAREVASRCGDPKPLVMPLIPYGVSYHHEDFSGTVSIGPDTLSRLVYEIGMNVARQGITKLLILNGHGGNSPALHFAAQMINRDAHIFTCVDTGESSDHDIGKMSETPNDVHAGEIETSTSLATRPELVRMDKARKLIPKFSSDYLDFTSKRSVTWYARTARISTSGVLGDPTKASREKGEKMWEVMVRNLVELVEHLKSMSLQEIYQTRY